MKRQAYASPEGTAPIVLTRGVEFGDVAYGSELWLSPRLASIALVAGGFGAVAAGALGTDNAQAPAFLFALCCYLAAGQIAATRSRFPRLARRSAVLWLAVLAAYGVLLFANPGLLLLLVLPILFGFAILGTLGGVAATAGMTCVLIGLHFGSALLPMTLAPPVLAAPVLATVLTTLWLALALLSAAYRPILRTEARSRDYIARAQTLLEEARDRNAALDQALNDLIRVNRQLDLVNERLDAARALAEEVQKAKTNFVAKVSHEFRTPLNMIIGLTDFVIQQADAHETLPADVRSDLNVIHRNARHLSTLINDVLDLSQVEAGQMALQLQWVDLGAELRGAVEVVLPLLQKKGLAVQVTAPDNLPQVFCDPVRIRQVLLNLISNAARHTAEGYVRIGAEADHGHIGVWVADSGSGIDPKDLERIFDPFVRGNRSFTNPGEGSGLGLTVSKQLIEQHQGAIWVESEVGRGSTFRFRLPLLPPAAPLARAHRWISEEWNWKERTAPYELPGRGFDWRVLLWDPQGCAHALYSKVTSAEVELVRTQALGETLQESAQIPAHLVVVNELDPSALWEKMAAVRARLPDTPVLGCAIPPAVETRRTPDVADYLIKPVTRADLSAVLASLPAPVRRVLVVDDDPDVRQLFGRMLADLADGLEITTAAGSEEALARFEAETWDLILLDIVMPLHDGWSLLEAKQRLPHLAPVPVVIVSAQDVETPPDASPFVAGALAEGIAGDFIVEMGFRLAAQQRAPRASLHAAQPADPGC